VSAARAFAAGCFLVTCEFEFAGEGNREPIMKDWLMKAWLERSMIKRARRLLRKL
jgi:hypothetical protein